MRQFMKQIWSSLKSNPTSKSHNHVSKKIENAVQCSMEVKYILFKHLVISEASFSLDSLN